MNRGHQYSYQMVFQLISLGSTRNGLVAVGLFEKLLLVEKAFVILLGVWCATLVDAYNKAFKLRCSNWRRTFQISLC